jgi:hypothetical protein
MNNVNGEIAQAIHGVWEKQIASQSQPALPARELLRVAS